MPVDPSSNVSRADRWNERYRSGEAAGKPPERILVEAISGIRPGRALDVACGLGRNALFLARQRWTVTAVDYSDAALQSLAREASGLSIDLVRADLEAGEYRIDRDSFDLVCDCLYLQRSLFAPMRDGVRPGGLFIGVFPLVAACAEPPTDPAFLLEPQELRGIFSDWEIDAYSEDPPDVFTGKRPRARIAARKPRQAA